MSAELYETFRSLWVVWLMLLFVGLVVWTLWPSRKRSLDQAARIPLQDDPDVPAETAPANATAEANKDSKER